MILKQADFSQVAVLSSRLSASQNDKMSID